MSEHSEIKARFVQDTAGHQLRVLHDDGLYRHLRFATPAFGSILSFDLITWPGCLTIRGDIREAYTFTRLPDMFEFFRGKRINPHYWSEKLDGDRNRVMRYDQEIFEARVKEYVAEAIRDGWAPRGIGKAVREEILDSECLGDEHEARKLLEDFEFGDRFVAECSCSEAADVESYSAGLHWEMRHKRESSGTHTTRTRTVEGFRFSDVWEWSFSDYDWMFLWACHAIVWGIARYDRLRSCGLQNIATPKAVAA
ncbi:MAG: hypothetical protein HOY76_51485 [Streptomyces sp.]|nr:hypothetical protein [Streptomyces sp.]